MSSISSTSTERYFSRNSRVRFVCRETMKSFVNCSELTYRHERPRLADA